MADIAKYQKYIDNHPEIIAETKKSKIIFQRNAIAILMCEEGFFNNQIKTLLKKSHCNISHYFKVYGQEVNGFGKTITRTKEVVKAEIGDFEHKLEDFFKLIGANEEQKEIIKHKVKDVILW